MPLTIEEFRSRFPKITEYTNDNEVNALIKKLKFMSIGENKHILRDNQDNDMLYFVMEGQLESYIEQDGKKISIGKILPGEYIGEVSMLDGQHATSSVLTETRVVLYTLRRSAFHELEKEYPTISGKILRSISSILINRLRSADKLLFDGLTTQQNTDLLDEEKHDLATRDWFVKIYHLLHKH